MRFHRIRQAIRDGEIKTYLICSEHMVADIFTKNFSKSKFKDLRALCSGYGQKPSLPDWLHAKLYGEKQDRN